MVICCGCAQRGAGWTLAHRCLLLSLCVHVHVCLDPGSPMLAVVGVCSCACVHVHVVINRRSVNSIACESYLIVRPGGNVMVDTPRFNPVLAKRLQEMGGVKYIFLTHKVWAVRDSPNRCQPPGSFPHAGTWPVMQVRQPAWQCKQAHAGTRSIVASRRA